MTIHRCDHFRRGAPRHLRLDRRRVQRHDPIKHRVGIAVQLPPSRRRPLPQLALRRERPALDVFDGGLVRRHHTRPSARLDRHIADRHAAFHAQRPDGGTAEFDRVTRAAGGADVADDRQHDVFGGHARPELPVHPNQHGFGFFLDQALGRHHMLDLGSADAEGQRGQGAVGGGVRIAAHDGHAGQRRALLRADHMHDAAPTVADGKIPQIQRAGVGVQRLDLEAGDGIGDGGESGIGRGVVIGHRHHRIPPPRLAPGQLQPLERLRRGDFVDQMTVDVKQRGAVGIGPHQMAVPKLVVKRLTGHCLPPAFQKLPSPRGRGVEGEGIFLIFAQLTARHLITQIHLFYESNKIIE